MRFDNGAEIDDVSVEYRLNTNQGVWAVVRPDKYSGSVGRLEEIEGVEDIVRVTLDKLLLYSWPVGRQDLRQY